MQAIPFRVFKYQSTLPALWARSQREVGNKEAEAALNQYRPSPRSCRATPAAVLKYSTHVLAQGGRVCRVQENFSRSRTISAPAPSRPSPRALYTRRAPGPGTLSRALQFTTSPCTTNFKMAKFAVLFFACLALASARLVRREAPASSPLQELEKHAIEFQKTMTEQFNALSNSKSSQDLSKAFKEGSDSLLQQLSSLSTTLQNAMSDANGKAKEALEQAHTKLQQTAEDLRKSHPEVEQQVTQMREKLQTAVTSAVDQTQKLAKEVAANIEETNQKLAPQIKQAYDDFVKQAEQMQKKLHEAANKQ
ncbi:unnamed protein product, partial [Brenthis ino]